MSGINRFFFKNQEENAAVIRLYGVEKKNPPGRREGVAAMKKRLMVSLAVLMALWGGQALAQSAVVNNGSDPNSRLNMRDQPSRDASAVGQFYTGTPVEIVADAGDGWSQVTIGGGVNSLSGYMMTRYLAEDASAVQDMTKEMQVVSPYGTQSVVVRNTPSNSYDAVAMVEVGDEVRVIGTKGDYYYVLGRLPEHERGELIPLRGQQNARPRIQIEGIDRAVIPRVVCCHDPPDGLIGVRGVQPAG